jgi:SNF2 family DNA or RNA helicase
METCCPDSPSDSFSPMIPALAKTIMAGLLIKELLIRGDLHRCLIVCPGNLAEQWQDELYQRFQLPFEILTNDKLEAARTGNWFAENSLAIARLDKLSRNEDVQAKLGSTDWDLVVCDEATKCRPRTSAEKSSTPSAIGSGSFSAALRATCC